MLGISKVINPGCDKDGNGTEYDYRGSIASQTFDSPGKVIFHVLSCP